MEKVRLDEMTAEVEKTQENLQKARQSIQLVVISDPAEWPEWVETGLLRRTNRTSAIWKGRMDVGIYRCLSSIPINPNPMDIYFTIVCRNDFNYSTPSAR